MHVVLLRNKWPRYPVAYINIRADMIIKFVFEVLQLPHFYDIYIVLYIIAFNSNALTIQLGDQVLHYTGYWVLHLQCTCLCFLDPTLKHTAEIRGFFFQQIFVDWNRFFFNGDGKIRGLGNISIQGSLCYERRHTNTLWIGARSWHTGYTRWWQTHFHTLKTISRFQFQTECIEQLPAMFKKTSMIP